LFRPYRPGIPGASSIAEKEIERNIFTSSRIHVIGYPGSLLKPNPILLLDILTPNQNPFNPEACRASTTITPGATRGLWAIHPSHNPGVG